MNQNHLTVKVDPRDRFLFRCCSCSNELKWGQRVCDECNADVLKGLPPVLDKIIGFLIYLAIIAFVFLIVIAININMLNHAIPSWLVFAAAIGVASIKFKVSPGMGFSPKHAHVKLDISKLQSQTQNENEKFVDFRPSQWLRSEPEYKNVYDLLMDGIASSHSIDMVEVLAYFPEDDAVEMIHFILQNTDDENTMKIGIRSLVRIGTKKAVDILNGLSPEKVKLLLEEDQNFSDNDKNQLRKMIVEKQGQIDNSQ